MKTIKDIHKLVARKGGAGAFNRGYGNALEDVLELIDEIKIDEYIRICCANVLNELKARITG